MLPAAGLVVDELPVQPDDVDQQPLGQPVLAHDADGPGPALVAQLEVTVALDAHQVVALHARDRLGDRRAALVQPLGDAGAEGDDALLLELVDRPEVHLRGVDEIAHVQPSWIGARARRSNDSPRVCDPTARLDDMTPPDRPVIWWVRRDFRLADNPALGAAVDEGAAVLPLFVSDPVLRRSAGHGRAAWLTAAVADLDRVLRDAGGPGLTVLEGRPEEVVPRLAAALDAPTVHVSADFGPYGRRRDARVAAALARDGRELHATGSPYAVAPGTLSSQTGTPFQVFSPFHRAWLARGVHGPAPEVDPATVSWLAHPERAGGRGPRPRPRRAGGRGAARRGWEDWLAPPGGRAGGLQAAARRPGRRRHRAHLRRRCAGATCTRGRSSPTSRGWTARGRQPSPGRSPGATSTPTSCGTGPTRRPVRCSRGSPSSTATTRPPRRPPPRDWSPGRRAGRAIPSSTPACASCGRRAGCTTAYASSSGRSWSRTCTCRGRTARAGSWRYLHDGDVASNQLNWQWVAGCGNDPSPFYRVFNPTPRRRSSTPTARTSAATCPSWPTSPREHVHEPWLAPGGPPPGYPRARRRPQGRAPRGPRPLRRGPRLSPRPTLATADPLDSQATATPTLGRRESPASGVSVLSARTACEGRVEKVVDRS